VLHAFKRQTASIRRTKSSGWDEHLKSPIAKKDTDCKARPSETRCAPRDLVDTKWHVVCIAREFHMSVDDVRTAKNVFDSFDWDQTGDLDITEFEQAVQRLLEEQFRTPTSPKDRGSLVPGNNQRTRCWENGDTDGSGRITFDEFLRWYSSNGFKEDMMLSSEEIKIRNVARQWNVSYVVVDSVKKHFDSADEDGSGYVTKDEFEQVLYKALQVPPHMSLPHTRIEYFWSEIDFDGSGKVAFEEFLIWWLKYFQGKDKDEGKGIKVDLDINMEFYKSFRRHDVMQQLDPPAKPGGKKQEVARLTAF